jgi:hypothetical protein
LVSRHVAQHAGELVREEKWQYGDLPDRFKHQQGREDWALPVKFAVQGQYMPVHPDVFGQKWNLQF